MTKLFVKDLVLEELVANKPPLKDGICDLCGGLLIQRNDDKDEVISERLRIYHEKTAPLIAYYKKEGTLIEIPSSGSPSETFETILTLVV